MLFQKALRRELGSSAGLVFVILFTIVMAILLIQTLGRAANGRVDTQAVLPLLAFNAVNLLPALLTIALFISILSTLTRAHRDSEMVVWFASGQSLKAWIRPVLQFSIPFLLIIAALALFLTPWANLRSSEYKKRFEQREDIAQVVAGQFRESASSGRVFFVESLNSELTEVRNIFVLQTKNNRSTLVVARSGSIRDDGKDRFLVLEQGRRYSPGPGPFELDVLQFSEHGLRLDPKPIDLTDNSAKVKSTAALLRDPVRQNLAELHRRIAAPVSAFILCLLAIPLAHVNPRVGRSANIIVAVLLYFIYNSLINYAQAQIASGKLSFLVGVWVVHAFALGLVILLFIKRSRLGGLTGLLRRRFTSRVVKTNSEAAA